MRCAVHCNVSLQIEEQNNMLEVQAVNNKALLKEVEQLLQSLDVSPQVRGDVRE